MANDLENDNVDTIHATHNKALQERPTYTPPVIHTRSKENIRALLEIITSLLNIMDKEQIFEFCDYSEEMITERNDNSDMILDLYGQYLDNHIVAPAKFNEAVLDHLDREGFGFN